MQTEVNSSNEPMFENEFCLVTAEGALKQKNNSLFSGKTLEEGIESEQAEERAAHFKAAFSKLQGDVRSRLEAISPGLTPEEMDAKKQEFSDLLRDADAAGDFDALEKEVHDALAEKAAKTAPETDLPDDENLAADTAEAGQQAETLKSEGSAEEPVTEDGSAPEQEKKQDKAAEPESEAEAGSEDKKAESGSESESEEADEDGQEPDPEKFYRDLVKEAKEAAEIKSFKNASAKYDRLKAKWEGGPEFDHVDYYKLKDKFDEVEKVLETRRLEVQKQQEERKKKNLAFREELLDKIQNIIDKKKWSAHGEIGNLTRKFENVKPLPREGVTEQEERMKSLTAVFEENRVQYLVDVREKEQQNLMGKLLVIDKIETLIKQAGKETQDWEALNKEVDQLLKDWKKIGHVPREKEDEIWGNFHKAREQFVALRMEHDKAFGKEIEKNISRREKLIERAEKLTEADSLAEASREINHLHSEWKKAGPVPQQTHDDLWTRFKNASDAFNKIRDEHSDEIRKEEDRNLEILEKLIEQAEKLTDQDDWKGSKKEMDNLQEQWKETGPPPRKKSRALWRRFRKAMDGFYKERRKHFREVREEQSANLKAKRDIVAKIKELSEAEDIEAANDEVKKLQEEYKSIGFVPIKQKDKIWDQYHAACDMFFDELRKRGSKNSAPVQKAKVSQDKQITGEMFRLRKEIDELRDQILKYADTKTYFKPNKKGQKLIDEIQGNIDQAEQKLEEKEKRIKELQKQLDERRSD